jgi:aminoglycoside 3-N-acetyltransferase
VSADQLVAGTPSPRTRESLAADLRQLGVTDGMLLIVHSSLRSLGWVCGGAVAVVQALIDAITPSGSLLMPAFTSHCSDPASWQDVRVPVDWWPTIRETMPPFDPRVTPTREMGQIVEVFRTWPGVLRSSHPMRSFVAWGQHAEQVIADHSLDYPLGEASPLARVYELDGWVLLLGVSHDRNTSIHLAEHRAPGSGQFEHMSPVMEAERRVWKTYLDRGIGTVFFPQIGADFERAGYARLGQVGSAAAKLFRQRDLVDHAVKWFTTLHAGSIGGGG